jgi:hypothetical protein
MNVRLAVDRPRRVERRLRLTHDGARRQRERREHCCTGDRRSESLLAHLNATSKRILSEANTANGADPGLASDPDAATTRAGCAVLHSAFTTTMQ